MVRDKSAARERSSWTASTIGFRLGRSQAEKVAVLIRKVKREQTGAKSKPLPPMQKPQEKKQPEPEAAADEGGGEEAAAEEAPPGEEAPAES